jgi:hypothetical protein
MRISWLSAAEVEAARGVLTANGASFEDHFRPEFVVPPAPEDGRILDWAPVVEHVARAERVSAVVRDQGLAAARGRFAASNYAVEAATLAAAAHESGQLSVGEVIGVLQCPIDGYVFYAPFLELLIGLTRGEREVAVRAYEEFAAMYAEALADVPHGGARVGALRDGLADLYVTAGFIELAEKLFEERHEEDQGDVAVALSASRAFLAAGKTGQAVRWLGIGAQRAQQLGRSELAAKLRQKQAAVHKRLS